MDPAYMNVVYEAPDMSQMAVDPMTAGYTLAPNPVIAHVDYQMPNGRGGGIGRGRGGRSMNSGQSRVNDQCFNSGIPLRILVPSELVGAIIGKKGQTIRNITTTCKARVDVHGKENTGVVEKVISIFGQTENCSNACKEILKVLQQEANGATNGPVVLRMLADDRYCGRIIGKEGHLIKKIRDDSDTKITVSSMQEMAHIYPDRVITIRGPGIDNVVQAESAISSRLIDCVEKDAQASVHMGSNMMGGMPAGMPQNGAVMGGGGGYGSSMSRRNIYNPQGMSQNAYGPPPSMYGSGYNGPQAATEVCHIIVPNTSVGGIIGSGGSIIKQIMQDSNAHVSVESRKDDDTNTSSERTVVIRGTPDACWKASYFIFEKIKADAAAAAAAQGGGMSGGGGSGSPPPHMMGDGAKLKTAIKIPRAMVGRVIGKSGKNVREIQRMTGASIKLPEDSSQQQGEEILVEVYGTFMATQGANNRIRALVSQTFAGGDAYPSTPISRGVLGGTSAPRRPPPIAVQ